VRVDAVSIPEPPPASPGHLVPSPKSVDEQDLRTSEEDDALRLRKTARQQMWTAQSGTSGEWSLNHSQMSPGVGVAQVTL